MYTAVPKLLIPASFQIKLDGTEIFGEMGAKTLKICPIFLIITLTLHIK